jgi:phosphoserine phosphatase
MARKAMQQLQAREADLVKGLKFQLQRADLGDKGVFARLVIGAMAREEAERLCNRLKVRGHDCFVISLP